MLEIFFVIKNTEFNILLIIKLILFSKKTSNTYAGAVSSQK